MSGVHGKMRNAYEVLVRKPEGMKPLESHEHNIT
jgi:DNA/RNA endonuclease YhcR with UshA esterase domain